MHRAHLLIPVGLGALGAVATILVELSEPAGSDGLGAGVAQNLARHAVSSAAPAMEHDEALAASFQDQVMLHLDGGEAVSQHTDQRRAVADEDLSSRRPFRIARARATGLGGHGRAGSEVSERREQEVNWFYLQDVFQGRISGIPNERKAGVSLQVMDELGDIPYVEELRREKRYEELRDLGFENETVPWPDCLRKAACRLDSASSPP